MTTEKCPEAIEFNRECMARLRNVPRWESLTLLRRIQKIYHRSGLNPDTVARIRALIAEKSYKPGDPQYTIVRSLGNGHYVLAPANNKGR